MQVVRRGCRIPFLNFFKEKFASVRGKFVATNVLVTIIRYLRLLTEFCLFVDKEGRNLTEHLHYDLEAIRFLEAFLFPRSCTSFER